MNDRTETIQQLKKAMEFYRELGFQYFPVKLEQKSGRAEERKGKITEKAITPSPAILKVVPEPQTQKNFADKEAALKNLRDEMGDCRMCKLYANRTNIVFGEGSPDAEIMFIGEGPGKDEDLQARPFVGEAGKLLTRLIEKLGMKREEVYIANIVKSRPPNNREPEADEINACMPFLERQIDIIKPKVIVSLGRVSAQALLNRKIQITRLRGTFLEYRNIPLMPTFHPAYLLRNPKDKILTWEDMLKVLKILNKSLPKKSSV